MGDWKNKWKKKKERERFFFFFYSIFFQSRLSKEKREQTF
jgi:hypothetical protein